MGSFNSSTTEAAPQLDADRYSRLRRTATFRGGGFTGWSEAILGVIGAGMLGGRLALEAVRSGVGAVYLWDFDIGHPENQGNQLVQPGEAKVLSVARACDAIRPGVAHGFPYDIRHVGIECWGQCAVMVDCSDDPALAWTLTETGNGTATPLLRTAVDGSGESELGRVLCSLGVDGHTCQLCSYSLKDLLGALQRTPCLGQGTPESPPTLAGGAVASAVAGLTLLQAQRLVTGNDLERVLDREIILDLSNHKLLELQLQRCPQCLSGHRRWQLLELNEAAHEIALHELFGLAEQTLPTQSVTLAAYQHPLNTQACCDCGNVQVAAGTDWAGPPKCPRCGTTMSWLREMQIDRVSRQVAADLGILHTPLDKLGIPTDGAMFLARSSGHPIKRLLLRGTQRADRERLLRNTTLTSA